MRNSVLKQTVSSAAIVLAVLLHGGAAKAEADTFGLGTGRDGPLTVTNVAGQVINTYASVTAGVAAGATTVEVGARTGAGTNFVPGQVVMLFQHRGGFTTAPVSGTQTLITLTNATGTGRYELARVANVVGNTVTLTHGTVNAYDANDAQLVSVPEHTTVTLETNARLAAKAWDGTTGGVLAFLATGAVTNAGSIDGSATGFRGGAPITSAVATLCNAQDGVPTGGGAGAGGSHKGESLDPTAFSTVTTYAGAAARHFGRGNVANGGGGGNCFNAGGGGGGHGAVGGRGGNTNGDVDTSRAVGGNGGAPVSYDPALNLSFGGGGGAGEDDDGVGGRGGAGGGIVWIRAASLAGGQIRAAGETGVSGGVAGDPIYTDGGGGGGAGGSVYLRFAGNADCAGIDVRGGNGGSAQPATVGRSYGPGGGGAGGRVRIEAAGGTCNANLTGGTRGTTTAGAFGATSGGNGASTTGGAFTATACATATGSCGGCVTDAFCPPATPVCNTAAGATQWTCVAGTPVPPAPYGSDPSGGAQCIAGATPTQGTSSGCVNNLCDTSDSKCGYANGTPCTAGGQCRSDICATDGRCGLPNGDPCTTNTACRSNACGAGKCGDDTDRDGVTDEVETTLGTNPENPDSDGDGISDGVELRPNGGGEAARIDTDGDGQIDALDTDSDNDGLLDTVEKGAAAPMDSDGDGLPDYRDPDDDNDRVPTRQEVEDARRVNLPEDVDGDGRKNWLDSDADNDTVLDGDESGDANGDGIPDYLQARRDEGSLEGGGIGCASTPGSSNSASPAWLALVGLFALGAKRRRAK